MASNELADGHDRRISLQGNLGAFGNTVSGRTSGRELLRRPLVAAARTSAIPWCSKRNRAICRIKAMPAACYSTLPTLATPRGLGAAARQYRSQPAGVRIGWRLDRTHEQDGSNSSSAGRNDPDWGPIVLAGFGGVQAEILKDVRLLPPDLTLEEIVARTQSAQERRAAARISRHRRRSTSGPQPASWRKWARC